MGHLTRRLIAQHRSGPRSESPQPAVVPVLQSCLLKQRTKKVERDQRRCCQAQLTCCDHGNARNPPDGHIHKEKKKYESNKTSHRQSQICSECIATRLSHVARDHDRRERLPVRTTPILAKPLSHRCCPPSSSLQRTQACGTGSDLSPRKLLVYCLPACMQDSLLRNVSP
jgi:hypothetical protein